MKPRPRLLALLISVFCCWVTPSATAQTPLLEIDYQNATVFHVLSDGRVLLPAGAVDGYVLTADGQGFATWQAATSSGGLSVVSSNATLTGEGTVGSPLGVSVPLLLVGSANRIVQGRHTTGTYGYLGSADYGVVGEYSTGTYGYLGSDNYGVVGSHQTGTYGRLGSADYGAYGLYNNGNYGLLGNSAFGAYGRYNNGNYGTLGSSGAGVYGEHEDSDNYGYLGSTDYGAVGVNDNGNYGILGHAEYSVYGQNHTGYWGTLGGNFYGVFGKAGVTRGYLGHTDYGVWGGHNLGHYGTLGGSSYGAFGRHSDDSRGYLGHSLYGVWGTGPPNISIGYAGFFAGDVHVTGTLSGGSAASKVDHPLDPEGRYLSHSFVESPDMMNVYNGNTTTDAEGFATVTLPDYFEALNRDFRYQLTVIGQFAQAIIAEEIQGTAFIIQTDQPGVKVSWQVTGIRHDAWAEQNRLVVEQEKPAAERGRYLHPRLYDQSEAQRIGWIEDDTATVDHEAMRQQIDDEQRQIDDERQRMDQERQRMQAKRERAPRPTPPDNRP